MNTKTLLSQIPIKVKASLESTISRPALDLVDFWIKTHEIEVICTKERYSKAGDYRPFKNGQKHRITLNENLNPYSFFITLIHELAHFKTWEKHKRTVQPHGREWKTEYQNLVGILIPFSIFPKDIDKAFLLCKASNASST